MDNINIILENKINIILENKIDTNNFNIFAVEFYLLTNKILISLNKFLKLRNIKNIKILQIKNIGQLIYESKNDSKINELLLKNGYSSIPELTPQIAYYVIKKNKKTKEENWLNIIEVLKNNIKPTKLISNKNIFFSEEQKSSIKNQVQIMLELQEYEIDWIIETIRKINNIDKELFESFKKII